MTITASKIIQDCVTIAQDTTSTRWSIDEVCRYFNWAQREVLIHRPDAKQTRASITLAAGAKQALPSGALKLLDIHSNGSGGAVRLVNREILDATIPGWRALTGVTAVKHFMYDPKTPLVFEVYPPAASSGASVDASYSLLPTGITEASAGGTYADVSGNMDLPDQFAGAVTDLVLYRMYSKDADYAGNAARAQAHYGAAANTLGIEIKGTVAVAPTSPGNPNHPGASRATV